MAAKRFGSIRTCGESAQEGPRVRKVLLGCVESPKDLPSDPFKVYLPCPKNTQFWVWHFVGRKGRTRKLCVLAMEDWSHHAAAVLRAAEVQTFAEHCSCLRLLRLDPQQITSPDVGKSFRPFGA